MKNLEKLDKVVVTNISKEVNAFAQTLALKYGLKFQPKGGSYTNESFSPPIKFEVIATTLASGDSVSKIEVDILKLYGLVVGQEVTLNRKKYKIVGAKPRATKNDVKIKDMVSNKVFVANGNDLK